MAENKKSFILYCDLIHTVSKLPNDKAGELFKHILSYVNDENPITEDLIIQIAFEPVKLQLKRDLAKWESYIEKQRINGKSGGRPPKAKGTQKTQAFLEEPKKADNVTVTDTVTVIKDTSLRSELFERFWEQYERKGSKKAAREKYMKLQDKDIEAINIHLPLYLKSKPEKQFRKDAERYLSNRLWENGDIQELKENTITAKLPDNWWHIDLTPQQWELVPEKYRSEKRNADIRRAMGV